MKSRINPRTVINPKIVGYCIDKEKKDSLTAIASKLNIDISFVSSDLAGETVGYLVGINGLTKSKTKIENPPKCEVLLISGVKNTIIDKLLKLLREKNTLIDLKCIVTPINQNWEVYRLIEELQREHKAMHKKQ